jgi:hypothetical protein
MDAALVNALNRVRERAGGPGSRTYLAALGNWLRDDGVDITRIRPLSTFVNSLQGYCHISGEFVVFEDGPVPRDLAVSQTAKGSDDASTTLFMRGDMWHAMVNDRAETAYYLDLESLSIVDSGKDGTPADLERYLTIPTVSSEEQRAFVIDLLQKTLDAERTAALVPPGPNWMRTLIAEAPQELRRSVQDARRDWIVRRGQEWMRAHGIPERPFLRRNDPRDEGEDHAVVDRRRRPSTARAHRLREALHRAIDRMTDDELQALQVPARLLLD